MTDVSQWREALDGLDPPEWPEYVEGRSGLPGPRANLALVGFVAQHADAATVQELLTDGREYPVMCAAAAVGRRSSDPSAEAAARALADDERWRVREGVAIGLQLLGDTDPGAWRSIASRWVDDPSPLVQRAAVAAICEPRLLRTSEAAAAAVDVCARATRHLTSLPSDEARRPDARTLRQALGYGWSVAVAADPGVGLGQFLALDTEHPDVAWIVRENRRKKRLSTLL
ncbi:MULTISPECIES: HEAT repeat domain-containing protein [unclassified Aeromicrobium]|uniref:HEAT repeat domain-containing protein n=1 Tax=unclassified Aeromicrobium TaxID=2633570 RepID=UPI00396B008F